MSIKVGDVVEFESSYGPGTKRETRRGVVVDVGTTRFPRNPTVQTSVGMIEMLASNLRKVEVR